ARNTVLTDRVASLELELDVAKAKVPTFEPVAQAVPAPLDVATDSEWPGAAALSEAALERMASTFRLMRVGEGVFVEVNGEAPG
ncbi:hypothetical protein, partial [Limosilactobacillus reuteri]|uniref:hypothetical protein n=1 Tax=Limosilactobacillus reuteri TaxID=1598 RepID=UPI00207D0FB2